MISIQQLCKQAGVSSRMLRYYDETGLVKPVYRTDAGVRYYDESVLQKLKLISAFLFLGYHVDEIRESICNDQFNEDDVRELLNERISKLEVQKKMIDHYITTLKDTRDIGIVNAKNWDDVAKALLGFYADEKTRITHRDPNARFKGNLFGYFGSGTEDWLRVMFAPVVFEKDRMKMAEINASNTDYWNHNADRLPCGELDLFYDPKVGRGTEHIFKDGLAVTWMELSELKKVPDETYDLVFNDHLLFYGDKVEEGINEIRRVLKKGGRFYCTIEDGEHHDTLNPFVFEVAPFRKISYERKQQIAGLDRISSMMAHIFEQVNAYPCHADIKADDEEYLLNVLYEQAERTQAMQGDKNFTQQRYENVAEKFIKEFRKKGYIMLHSRYHIMEGIK